MGRISTGFALARRSWAVLRADGSLAVFPLVSAIAATVAFALLLAPGVAVAALTSGDWVALPFLLLAAYGATYATIYFNVALAGAAAKSLDGHDTTLRDGLAVARTRRRAIAGWAGVQFAVGIAINLIENALANSPAGRVVASIVGSILGGAWAIASFFVIPVVAFEGVGPKDALDRSVGLVRARWGEGFVGAAAIGLAVFLVGLLPIVALVAVAGATLETAPAAGVAAIALLVVVIIAMVVVSSALNTIFRVALYRYASTGAVAPGFDAGDLAGAFHRR